MHTVAQGLQACSVNGADVTNNTWAHSWLMPGEAEHVWQPAAGGGGNGVAWRPASKADTAPLSWFKATYDLPPTPKPAERGTASPAEQVSYALSMLGANKGVAFVNGFELGSSEQHKHKHNTRASRALFPLAAIAHSYTDPNLRPKHVYTYSTRMYIIPPGGALVPPKEFNSGSERNV